MNLKKTILLIATFFIIIGLIALTYDFLLSPTKNLVGEPLFEVNTGSSISQIARNLEEQKYIRSALVFKLYLKSSHINGFKAGTYELQTSMNAKAIADKLSKGESIRKDIKVTFPEGTTLIEMAEILSRHTNYTKEEIILSWNHPSFIDQVIAEFGFITEEIKEVGITYPLNGYLFPDTYYIANNASPQDIALKMIRRMEQVLSPYMEEIKTHPLSLHQLLTLASIVEYEAIENEDRPKVAGVFHNRLNNNMKLESCATLEMALGVHKEIYTSNDIEVISPYNTYHITGLPIAPGNNPGQESIKSCIFPEKHEFYYFLSDIYGDNKMYYSKTLKEHNALKAKYLSKNR